VFVVPRLFGRKCALVYVDDSPDDHFLLQHSVLTTETPFHIQPFFSAEPAIAYVKGDPPFQDGSVNPFPTLVLCDYDLKISQGPELVSVLRAIPSCANLPIFMFSSSDDQSWVLASHAAGADGYLCKPSGAGRLDTLVRTLYACTMSEPRRFEVLTLLPEYRPFPHTTTPSAPDVSRRAA